MIVPIEALCVICGNFMELEYVEQIDCASVSLIDGEDDEFHGQEICYICPVCENVEIIEIC